MEKISAAVAWRLADRLRGGSDPKQQQSGTATFSRMDDDGTAWIRIPGNDFDTPVEGGMYADANEGDTVTYTISGGQVSISGNATSPAVGGTYVAEKVRPVERKANNAIASAEQARTAADMATAEAGRASEAADAAQTSADDAATAAQQAIEDAATADGKAEAAATAASNAQTSANSAASAASAAQTSANSAAAAAAVADEKAVAAGNAAAAAQTSANFANTYANAALDQLGIVQDVIGVLTWATEHGTFNRTTDTTIVEGKVYFTYDSQTGDYTPVIDPQASALSTYYELSVDEAMEAYIMAHLAVTSRGLWVLPSGIGSGTTPASGESQQDSDARQGSGYKMLLAANGIYLYDSNGVVATNVGENITFSSMRDWYVGSNDAYIFYDASEGVINIGGTGVKFNGTKTLSALLSDVSSAASAASAAQSTADGANGREQLIYRSAASGTSSMTANTTWVTDATGGQNKWTTVRPEYSQTYPVLFVATQRQTVAQTSGTACTCTTPAIDKTTTVIDGGRIITGSVTANQIDAASLTIGYSQLTDTPSIPSKTSDLTNDSSFATTTQVNAAQSAAEATAAADATTKANDAKKYATNYISADSTGIRIADANPATATTYQHQTATETEFVVNNVSRTLISGDGLRIGGTNESHVVIDNMSQTFYDGNQNEVFKIKSGYIEEESVSEAVAVIVTPTDRITDPDALYIYRIDINDTALSDEDWTVLDDDVTIVFTSTVSGDIHIYYSSPSEIYYQAPQIVIGTGSGKNHMYLDYHSMQLVDKEGTTYFHVSDLRDASGLYETIDTFTGNGTKRLFPLSFKASSHDYTVKVDGVEVTSGISRGLWQVDFTTAPPDGAVVTVEYATTSEHAKAYTLGFRASGSKVGAMSLAEGINVTASSRGSHAEGSYTESINEASHAEGISTVARGLGAHAEGISTVASGSYSHAQNNHTIAAKLSQTVLGTYNVEDTATTTTHPDGFVDHGTYAVIVGNGSAENARSNAFTVDWGGNITSDGGLLKLDNAQGETRTYLQAVEESALNRTRLGTHRSVNDADVYNNLNLIIDDSGNRSVAVSEVAPWLDMLGLSVSSTTATRGSAASSIGTNSVRKYGKVVSVTLGSIQLASAVANGDYSGTIATVPSGYRPATNVFCGCGAAGANLGGSYVRITTAGVVAVRNQSGGSIAASSSVLLAFTLTYVIE